MNMMTAFLYGFLDETIYVKQAYLFELNSELVCYLWKVLYRLKQVLQVWYKTFTNFLKKFGLNRLELDHNVFVLHNWQLFFAIYMDNFFVFVFDKSSLIDILDQLSAKFKMTDLREIFYYLDIKVDVKVRKQIFLWQTTYLKKRLERFQIADYKPASIFMNPNIINSFFPSE